MKEFKLIKHSDETIFSMQVNKAISEGYEIKKYDTCNNNLNFLSYIAFAERNK